MKRNRLLWSFGIYIVALPFTYAASSLPLQQTSFSTLQRDFYLAMPNLKLAVTNRDNSLAFVSQHTDENHVTHLRMQQQYVGFPVFGGYAVLHSKQKPYALLHSSSLKTNSVTMNGTVYEGLQAELGQPAASFVKQGKAILQRFKANYDNGAVSEEQVTPMVYIDEQHQAHWAYKVSLLVSHENAIPERPTAILDAKTEAPFLQWNDVKTARTLVQGQGFGGNERTGKYQYGLELPFLMMTRDDATATCYMENPDVQVINMKHRYSGSKSSMSFSCQQPTLSSDMYWTGQNGDGYDEANGGYSPSDDALYAGQVIKHLYKDWYGLDVLMNGTKPMKLTMRVHYGEDYQNAYWDGRQMTFGDGGNIMYPLVSLGIGAHEISHGFTEQHANLQYVGQSGGMNEAFSDMAAQAAEYFAYSKNNWTIGAEIMKSSQSRTALRYMDKPSRDGKSIESANQYREDMDVHYSSGVYNRLFYILATTPSWDVKQAFQVMVKANLDYWIPTSTFEEGACGIMNAARDLGKSVDDIKQALDQVLISYQSCL